MKGNSEGDEKAGGKTMLCIMHSQQDGFEQVALTGQSSIGNIPRSGPLDLIWHEPCAVNGHEITYSFGLVRILQGKGPRTPFSQLHRRGLVRKIMQEIAIVLREPRGVGQSIEEMTRRKAVVFNLKPAGLGKKRQVSRI